MKKAVGRSARIASVCPLSSDCFAWFVSSKMAGWVAGLMTSVIAVSDVVPVCAPRRRSDSS
jgi:hypothetical protein